MGNNANFGRHLAQNRRVPIKNAQINEEEKKRRQHQRRNEFFPVNYYII